MLSKTIYLYMSLSVLVDLTFVPTINTNFSSDPSNVSFLDIAVNIKVLNALTPPQGASIYPMISSLMKPSTPSLSCIQMSGLS
jgi:hypothetical protein